VQAARKGREGANHAHAALQLGDPPEQFWTISRRQLMNCQTAKRETGDVHFLYGATGILQKIEGCFGNELEAGGSQLLENRSQRRPVSSRQLLEIGEREARPGRSMSPRGAISNAIDGSFST